MQGLVLVTHAVTPSWAVHSWTQPARARVARVSLASSYCSLPQPSRTPPEDARFQAGLSSLMTWYAHPYTHVLLMTGPLPAGGAGVSYTNTRRFEERGWTETERRTCAVSKCAHCMWDYAGWAPERLEGLERMQKFDELRAMLRTGRPTPMAPPTFAHDLRARVNSGELSFTAESDLETVIDMYKRGFVQVFELYRDYDPDGFFAAYAAQGWSEEEAKQVASALGYAAKVCKGTKSAVSLRLEGNNFGKAGQAAIANAIKASKCFSEVQF